MPDTRFIEYLRSLKPEDWHVMATAKWAVKDVVAHMIAWEKGDVEAIRVAWETKELPWWKHTENYDKFNDEAVEAYKNHTPEQLIAEWESWQKKVAQEMDTIGHENLHAHPKLFDWLFEGITSKRADGSESHYMHHFLQIKRAVNMNAAPKE